MEVELAFVEREISGEGNLVVVLLPAAVVLVEREIRGEENLVVVLAAAVVVVVAAAAEEEDEEEEVEGEGEGEGDKYLEETCLPLGFLVTVEPLSLRGGLLVLAAVGFSS